MESPSLTEVAGLCAAMQLLCYWILRAVIENGLREKLAKVEAGLKLSNETTLDQQRATLKIAELQYQIKFSGLHQNQAHVIDELYKQLVDILFYVRHYVGTGKHNSASQGEEAQNRVSALIIYAEKNRLYFPTSIWLQISKFVNTIRGAVDDVHVYSDLDPINEEERKEKHEAWKKAWEGVRTEAPQLLEMIEASFRDLLGVKESEADAKKIKALAALPT